MSKRIFSLKEASRLRDNPNVLRCTPKYITYHPNFKSSAVARYARDGLSPVQIFQEAGFDVEVIGRKTPIDRLKEWRKVVATRGMEKLMTEKRGRPPRQPNQLPESDQEKIRALEDKVAYLQAENAFLARLRAGKKR